MAAHPFGPIENQLIVGYYKRGFDPTRVKPRFLERNVVVPNSQHNPIHHILQPVFYGWSPANGNSSSHDFKVTHGFQLLLDDELLSRGLGYRITFTMPSKQIVKNDQNTWPTIDAEVLDFFGEKALCKTSRKMQNGYLERHLVKYRSLLVEYTPLYWKFIENCEQEHVFPSFGPSSSESAQAFSRIAQEHQQLLGKPLDQMGPRGNKLTMSLFHNVLATLEYLSQNSQDESNLSKVTKHFQTISSLAIKVLKRVEYLLSSDTKAALEAFEAQANSITDPSAWITDEGRLGLIAPMKKMIQQMCDQVSNQASDSALTSGIYTAEYVFLKGLHPQFCMHQLLSYFRVIIEQELDTWKNPTSILTLQTKRFTIEYDRITNQKGSEIMWKFWIDFPKAKTEKRTHNLPLRNEAVQVVPGTDLVVSFPVRSGSREQVLRIVDLYAIHTTNSKHHQKGPPNIGILDLPPFQTQSSYRLTFTAFVSSKGITISDKWIFDNINLTHGLLHFAIHPESGIMFDEEASWAEINLGNFLGLNPQVSVYQSSKTRAIYAAEWYPGYPKNTVSDFRVHQCRFDQEANVLVEESTLIIADSEVFGKTLVWMETQWRNRSYMYACVFTSDRLVSVWYQHDKKFVQALKAKIPQPQQATGFMSCRQTHDTVGVCRWRFVCSTPNGFDCYRVGRLYLKY